MDFVSPRNVFDSQLSSPLASENLLERLFIYADLLREESLEPFKIWYLLNMFPLSRVPHGVCTPIDFKP